MADAPDNDPRLKTSMTPPRGMLRLTQDRLRQVRDLQSRQAKANRPRSLQQAARMLGYVTMSPPDGGDQAPDYEGRLLARLGQARSRISSAVTALAQSVRSSLVPGAPPRRESSVEIRIPKLPDIDALRTGSSSHDE